MIQTTPFFLFFLLLVISIPSAYAVTTATAEMLPEGQVVIEDEVVLDNNTNLDVSDNVQAIPTETKSVGGQTVELKEGYKFNTSKGEDVVLKNTALPSISVEIPDRTIVKAPESWNGIITPPKSITTKSTPISGFITPTSSIIVGSPDVVLVFDTAVTIILNGVSGTVAYKTPGGSQWIIISGCTGTFENPNNPSEPGECSISDGTNTKILTFHFTEFAGLSVTPTPTTTGSSGNSGGHGNTGVGSPRVFGSSGGSSGGGGEYYGPPGETKQSVFPSWFDNVTSWYKEGKISATEFLMAYQWIVENLL